MMLKEFRYLENETRTPVQRVRLRLILSVCLMVAGAATLSAMLLFGDAMVSDFLRGFYTGVGGGLFLSGLVFLIRNLRLWTNEEALRKQFLEETDERNRHIVMKASALSFYGMATLIFLGVLVAGFVDMGAFQLMVILCMATPILLGVMRYLVGRSC